MSGTDTARAIYQASHQRLVVQLYGITGDLEEAQDVVQEAFVRGLMRDGRLATMDNPEAWLRTVAVNVARSRWRRRQVMERFLVRRQIDVPTQVAGMTETHIALVTALRQLPRAQREVVVMHYLADLSVDEVAAALSVAPGTVKSRLHRARSRLAELLDPNESPLLWCWRGQSVESTRRNSIDLAGTETMSGAGWTLVHQHTRRARLLSIHLARTWTAKWPISGNGAGWTCSLQRQCRAGFSERAMLPIVRGEMTSRDELRYHPVSAGHDDQLVTTEIFSLRAAINEVRRQFVRMRADADTATQWFPCA